MNSFYLNSFQPLVVTREGVAASSAFNLPPFIDGSIRREPDFQHPCPVITCLCRGGQFAPRLRPGDHVAYLTVKHQYRSRVRHQRLVAVLAVERLFDSHGEAAACFHDQRMDLPNNLMVQGNQPNPLDHSHRQNRHKSLPDEECRRRWDLGYPARARTHGRVVGCRPLFIDTSWAAPEVTDEDLAAVFGYVPGTRNPGRLDLGHLGPLLDRLGAPALPAFS